MMLLAFIFAPRVYASPLTVGISPGNQAVPQGSNAMYNVALSGALAMNYALSLSGLGGASAAFGSNPLGTPPGGGTGAGTTTLTISTSNVLYCPGTYSFTVSATNSTDGTAPWPQPPGYPNPDAGSASATITVIQVGPPLSVTVATDKPTYRIGDKVTILLSANRPAEGRLTISPPSGAPQIFDYQLIYGGYSISKTLTASSIGHWVVTFQADDFCSGFSSAQAAFEITPDTYDITISLDGVPPQYSTQLKVDDQPQGTIGGGDIKKLTFKIDTSHTIIVDPYISGDTGVRYFTQQNSWQVNSAGSHTFVYGTQYLFTVATDPDGITPVTGGGWYKAGTTVQTNQVPTTVAGAAGTQYAFQSWEVDGVGQSGNGITLNMDKPHKAVAKYETEYQLLVDSPFGDPKGQGYYTAGSTATFSVTTPFGFPVQQIFLRWEGDFSSTQPRGSITMDKPHVIHAVWTTSYIPLIALVVAAVAIVGGLLFWRRRRGPAPETKPMPPGPSEEGEEAPGSIKCGNCGTENAADQKFCTNCGEKLASKHSKDSKGKGQGLRIGKPEES